jgi:hypothetical protein
VGTIWNTQINCVGRMLSFGMLKRVVHIVTAGLYKVNYYLNSQAHWPDEQVDLVHSTNLI